MKANNKVVLNTGVLYAKMLITVGAYLYTTRLVLDVLGTVDYGIFNLIAGVIAVLGFLNEAMATSTQRYLSIYQGMQDIPKQRSVFTQSLQLHVKIGLFMVVALILAGNWLFNDFLVIPLQRVEAAQMAYYMMVLSVFSTILTVPFTGSLVAHENMLWVAVVGILEIFLKLALALFLYWVDSDKLITYSIGMSIVSLISFCTYALYCFWKYPECTLKGLFNKDKRLSNELTSFAGWNLFGALCGVGRSQGTAIIFNLFFGPLVNASYAVASQVSSQMSFFSATLLRAINPQIMKSEGAGNRERMLRLSMTASKYGFFLFAIFAIPCIFEMEAVLAFWLKDTPPNTVVFCQLMLITIMCNQLTVGLQPAMQAIGRIKVYQMVVGSTILMGLPISYLLLYLGFSAVHVLSIWIVIELIACCFRLYLINRIAGPLVGTFLREVTARELAPVIFSVVVCTIIFTEINIPYRFVLTITISCLAFLIGIYCFGISEKEKEMGFTTVMKFKLVLKGKLKLMNN